MNQDKQYNKTIYACFIAYIVQAIVNNFVPLLFLTFQSTYHISLDQITLLVTFNFGIQLLIDLVSVKLVDQIGYRLSILIAHGMAAAGLVGLTILPEVLPDPYMGLLLAVAIYAIGGGLIEVLVSPIVEACPTERKEAAMSLLHSFYCWGHVGVVIISTVFFYIAGIQNWKILAIAWALIPLCNGILFRKVPIAKLVEEENGWSVKRLFSTPIFYLLLLMMVCSGASEQAVSQWASAYAEKSLGLVKAVGDLAGPLLFAVMMGASRAWYGKKGDKIELRRFMYLSSILCIVSYLVIFFTNSPIFGMIGYGLCGLSVGIMWPGTFSIASASLPYGGTAMFALLALAGDLGCQSGPTLVGFVSNLANGNLRVGIITAIVFPVLLLIALLWNKKTAE
ncbi:N-acetyl-D-glucosamine permease 2, possible [Lachnospiraceae bacterium KM106-2]|nr:N-acetyl-D-glucosamine permease 2, possible [Lachnospiraceae bacterium KM106-2]